jgi:hypothetical protein
MIIIKYDKSSILTLKNLDIQFINLKINKHTKIL